MGEPIGLIAGGGSFPLLFAAEAKKAGREVVAVGLNDISPKEIEQYAGKTGWFRLGNIDGPISFLRESGVRQALMVGSIPHVNIFGGILPDFRAAKLLLKLRDKKAGAIFAAVAEEFSADGIELVSTATLLEHLLVKPGLLAGKKPDADTLKTAAYGWRAAKAIAALDIGLTVVLRDQTVIAAEGMEGTDECIRRAGQLTKGRGGSALTVVKVARPGQDMRFDLPVAGAPTLRVMKSSGASTLVLEAGKTLILGMEEFLAAAKETGITVLGADDGVFSGK
ncbi:MAG: UDP-2,3-diacylglucosamine diphosphatase LpxI [Elusimicrobiales bacterium]|nr:UDP-2,3-diacylglucosamine diphosphatase LpxI [Elusimicrobiales bacterium]